MLLLDLVKSPTIYIILCLLLGFVVERKKEEVRKKLIKKLIVFGWWKKNKRIDAECVVKLYIKIDKVVF